MAYITGEYSIFGDFDFKKYNNDKAELNYSCAINTKTIPNNDNNLFHTWKFVE